MMCVHSRARAHTIVSTAVYMHNSGATNASSHVGERNIKKRDEHKATGAVQARGAKKGRERSGEGDAMVEEGSEIGRQKEERRRRHKRRD